MHCKDDDGGVDSTCLRNVFSVVGEGLIKMDMFCVAIGNKTYSPSQFVTIQTQAIRTASYKATLRLQRCKSFDLLAVWYDVARHHICNLPIRVK